MAQYPPAPMAPPGWGVGQGPVGALPGAIPVEEWDAQPMAGPAPDHRAHGYDPFDDIIGNVGGGNSETKRGKKDKDKEKQHEPIEVRYEGYLLHKITPDAGVKPSWARVGKRKIPLDSDALYARGMDHRRKTGMGPVTYFQHLSPNQQGIVDRLVLQHKREEKDGNVDWILFDVAKVEKDVRINFWKGGRECTALRVILRRQDKNFTKSTDKTAPNAEAAYQQWEIIDLTRPDKEKKDEKKKKKKKNKKDDFDGLDDYDDLADLGLGNNYRPQQEHGQYNAQQGTYRNDIYAHAQPQYQQPQPDPYLHAPAGPPPVAIPISQQQYPPQQDYTQNPFQPNPELGVPEQYAWPQDGYETRPSSRPRPRVRTRSPSARHRSPSARRRSSTRLNSQERRRLRDINDGIENINDKLDRMNVGAGEESSESAQDSHSMWSIPPSGPSFTPPSTPPRSPKLRDARPRGSLHRRQSSAEARSPHYRSDRRYRDERVEMQPAYTYRERDRERDRSRYVPERRHSDVRRPRLLHANTYDADYPDPRASEPRYLPQPRIQRRLTDYPEAYDEADYDNMARRRRDSGIDYTRVGRRESRILDPVYADDLRREQARGERRRGNGYYI